MCGSHTRNQSGEDIQRMPRAASVSIRNLQFLLLVLALISSSFSQQKSNPKQTKEPGKKPQSTQEAQQPEAAKAGTAESGQAGKAAEEAPEEAKGPWHGLTWRLVGPYRGGRALAVSGVVGDSHTYYFGSTGGGVWKSTDGGLSWHNVTDKTKGISASIGAIAVAPSDPNVIYAGTGEACIRGDIIAGNGVYKSID